MPIYEYRCTSCGHELEALQKLADARLIECPACHAAALTKKVSAAGFQLKGSGWYVTDFRNSGAKAPAKDAAAKAGDKPNGAGDTKTDAKAGESGSTESTTPTTKTGDAPAAATESKPTTTTSSDKTAT